MKLHPVYGYDIDAVPHVKCLLCDTPIGNEDYVEIKTTARFGQMLFAHKRCDEGGRRSETRR